MANRKVLTRECARAHAFNIVRAEKGEFAARMAQGTIDALLSRYAEKGYGLAVDLDNPHVRALQAGGHIQTEN